MASNPHRGGAGGSLYGGADPYRSREGLSTRNASGSEEVQLRIDPMHSDLDDEIIGLHGQVRQLKNIAQEIGSEAKSQRDFLDELQEMVSHGIRLGHQSAKKSIGFIEAITLIAKEEGVKGYWKGNLPQVLSGQLVFISSDWFLLTYYWIIVFQNVTSDDKSVSFCWLMRVTRTCSKVKMISSQ